MEARGPVGRKPQGGGSDRSLRPDEVNQLGHSGLLDPARAQTRGIMEQVVAVIERRPSHRTLATDSEIWREAGILSGTLARLQGYKSGQRRRVLNDALLFATARKHGCSVLTRNVLDFDFLQQLDPSGKVLFYR